MTTDIGIVIIKKWGEIPKMAKKKKKAAAEPKEGKKEVRKKSKKNLNEVD